MEGEIPSHSDFLSSVIHLLDLNPPKLSTHFQSININVHSRGVKYSPPNNGRGSAKHLELLEVIDTTVDSRELKLQARAKQQQQGGRRRFVVYIRY